MDSVVSKRNIHIDLLRITACFLIVLSHVSASNCESLPLCCIVAGIYLFVCSLPVKCAAPVLTALTRVSGLTFGVYMIHPLIVTPVNRLLQSAGALSPLFAVPLGTVLSFLCSLLIVLLLSLIPGVRRWLLFLRTHIK